MAETFTVDIDRLGAHGDGIAEYGDGAALYVPFALPGERVEVASTDKPERARLVAIGRASPQRVAPPCPYFGRCGGCAMQHLEWAAYLEWKRSIVVSALANHGLDLEVSPVRSVGEGARRRAVLTAQRNRAGVRLGFHEAGSHDLVDIESCVVLDPGIVALLPRLRELLKDAMEAGGETRVHVLQAMHGADVDLSQSIVPLTPKNRARLAEHAARLGLVRLSVDRDPLYQSGRPEIETGGVRISPPPAAFLQASEEAERIMGEHAAGALRGKVRQIADLFCGVGALSFVLARRAKVLAVDNDGPAIEALEEARRYAQGLRPVEPRLRDLFREPLSRKELEPFDAVVFDPPRAGAKAQAEMLAKSKVPTVVAVSCSPPTLARDLRILVDGGYRIEAVMPVDQFVYASHVEVVVVLRR